MNTLTGIEAERVNQILRHAVERLQILSCVPTNWDDDLLTDVQCQAITDSMSRQWMAEEQLRAIGDVLGSSDAGGKDLSIIKQAHRSTRALSRNLQADRNSLQILMNRPEFHSEEFAKFIKYLVELKSQVHTRLTTTVEDEAANIATLHDLTERERHLEESRDALQKKLNEVREEKERVIFGLDQTLRKLQLELHDIKQHNTIEVDAVQKEMSDAINKSSADHELRVRQLQDQVDGMERQIAEVVDKNKDEEQRLRKEKTRAEVSLSSKIAAYDEDMKARRSELDTLQTVCKKEAEEHSVLKAYFDKIDADLNRETEEQRILSSVKRYVTFGRTVLDKAAAAIQKIARGRQARAIVAKMKTKKGGKAKGKKAKK